MVEFDKELEGFVTLEKIEFKRILRRKVRKANAHGDKISIPKELNLEGKEVIILIPKE